MLGELVGYLIVEPMRGALVETLYDSNSAVSEKQLVKGAMTILNSMEWKAKPEAVRKQIARLHAVGMVEPVAIRSKIHYRLTEDGRAAARMAYDPPSI